MKAQPIHRGPWQMLTAVRHALCADGRRRYVKITSQPDTWFSIPGAVKVKGKSVSGYVCSVEGDDEDMEFRAITSGKNAALLARNQDPT